jgi:hypothetical protein
VPEVGLEPTRDCPHRILSPPCSRTEADTEGHREIKQHFYQVLAHLEGQGETPGCGQIAVKICDSRIRTSRLRLFACSQRCQRVRDCG